MSITYSLRIFLISLSMTILAQNLKAQEQAPYGSCLVSPGVWCWPAIPGTFGQPCSCPTSTGIQPGTIQ